MRKIAVVDLGSNSIRMSIFDEQGNTLFANRQTIRLSEGMTDDMILRAEPQMRAVSALAEYKRIMDNEGIAKYRVVATAAVRKAKNKSEFLNLVESATGIAIDVIDGTQEAALDCLAVSKHLKIEKGIICDIGGGSTELIGISKSDSAPMVSIPYGSRGICELFFKEGETPEAIQNAQDFADKLVLENDWLKDFKVATLVGIGGTLRALAKLDAEDFGQSAIEGYEVSTERLTEIIEKIEKADFEERKQMAGIGERADIIMGGLVLAGAVLNAVNPQRIAVADVGVREGVFWNIIENRKIL